MVVSAFYSLQLIDKGNDSGKFLVKRLQRVGYNAEMHKLFDNFQSIVVKKLGPIESACGYTGYSFEESGNGPVIFEMCFGDENVGLVKTLYTDDAILFLQKQNAVFEIYVFEGKYSSSILLLQMLKDGEFGQSIEEIKKRFV